MILQVNKKEVSFACQNGQRITVKREGPMTIIDCDIDVVSVGVAVEVLKELYENKLKTLDPKLRAHTKQTVREAVHEEH